MSPIRRRCRRRRILRLDPYSSSVVVNVERHDIVLLLWNVVVDEDDNIV